MENIKTGKIGEYMAYKYLINNKYLILTRNHKERFDEIDIIARHPDGTLVFCEVKTSNINSAYPFGFMPEDHLSYLKLKKMIRACNSFLVWNGELVREERGWQIDLIAIVLENGKLANLRHYQNI
jgi:putative endonuclease